jgi:hypothetical protein
MYEYELEGEYEGEEFLGTIARGIGSLLGESEYESEFESESELEAEYELEGEAEAEAFFGTLARLARGALRSPALRRVAQTAARAALNGTPPQAEFEEESEWESEYESEAVLNPIRRVYPDALMEHFGHAAAEAESEAEAEALIGALVPLARRVATRALPRVARAVARTVTSRPRRAVPGAPQRAAPVRPRITPRTAVPRAQAALRRVSPQLVRGATRVVRTLRRVPAMRPLVRVMPAIVQRTINRLGQQAALGRPVTAGQAVQTLARQTASVIGSPQQAAKAYQRSMALDHGYHTGASDPGVDPSAQSAACPLCQRPY